MKLILKRHLDTLETRLRRKFTRLHGPTAGRKYSVELVVGVQSFTLTEDRTRTEAEWFRDMLAKALAALVTAERK